MLGALDTRRRHPRARLLRAAAHLLIVAAVFIAALLAFVIAPATVRQPLRKLDLLIYDACVQRLSARKPDSRIVVVGMDEATLTHIAGLGRPFYPLPRACHARVVDELRRAGAKVIGFDVMFRDPQPGDPAFAAALRRHGNVIAALAPDTYEGHGVTRPVYVPITPTLRGSLLPASVAAPSGPLGRLRGLDPCPADPDRPGVRYRQFAFALVAAYFGEAGLAPEIRADTVRWGKHIEAPLTNDDKDVLLRYAGPPGTFGYVPYQEVYNGTWRRTRPEAYFRDKIVLIGPMQPLTDRFDTPAGKDMAGVELEAQAARMILHRDYLRPAAPIATVWGAAGLTALLLLVLRGSGAGFVPVAVILIGGGWALCAQQAMWWTGLWLPTAPPVAGLILGAVLTLAYESWHEGVVLRRLVPLWLGERAPGSGPAARTRAAEREATVVYCEMGEALRRHSAALPAEWRDALSRRWRDTAAAAARQREGALFEQPDGSLLLCFDARRGNEPHPLRAVRCAQELSVEAAKLHRSGAAGDAGFRVGVGVAAGPVLEGMLRESGGRKGTRTVTGDTVGIAVRLAEASPRLRRPILATAATFALVKDAFSGEPLGPQHIKGRQAAVEVVAVLPLPADEATAARTLAARSVGTP